MVSGRRLIALRGHFITFEGGEGSGKSTHAATLAQKLKALGQTVVLTREPGGSTGAEIIRHILLSGIAKPLGAETEAILFAAARDDHVRNTILPALKSGNRKRKPAQRHQRDQQNPTFHCYLQNSLHPTHAGTSFCEQSEFIHQFGDADRILLSAESVNF